MLNLACDTSGGWFEAVRNQVSELLLDHAHLERKAAGNAVNLLFRYPEHAFLQRPLSELAREELTHFECVLRELEARGGAMARQRASPYAGTLHSEVRSREPERLLDTLLVAALIEARSCERFTILADGFAESDPPLSGFYRELLASEARHHGVYLRLAESLVPAATAKERLRALAAREAELTETLERRRTPQSAPRLHG